MDVKNKLQEFDINARVISAPCLDIFDKQGQEYKDNVLRKDTLKVAIEAGCSMGWHKYIGEDGLFFGIRDNSFGISAPAEQVYEYFGLTVENIVNKIKEKCEK